MATYTAAYTDIRINDNTRFRTQGQFFSDSFESAGWTKQGDSGQIDWASVSAPGAANTSQGYEIRSASGSGIYLKIEYGSGGATYSKGFWLTIGTGTDSAGTITGTLLTRLQISSSTGFSGASARAGDDFISGATTRLSAAWTDDTNATYGGFFALQKTHDLSLSEDSYGWWLYTAYSGGCNPYAIGAMNYNGGSLNPGTVRLRSAVGDASNIPVVPCMMPHPLYGHVAMRDILFAPTALVTHQGSNSIAGRTYLTALAGTTSSSYFGATLAFNHSILMRYE
jgi:hypothetical protein